MSETPAPTRPAATVLIFRPGPDREKPEVFMVKRHHRSGFMASAHVFPGGRVDEADHAMANALLPSERQRAAHALPEAGEEAAAFFLAAVRETAEECGVVFARDSEGAWVTPADAERIFSEMKEGKRFWDLLKDAGWRPDPSALLPYAWWITPEAEPRRYDTRFFLAPLPGGHRGSFDQHETVDADWFSAPAALKAYREGAILLAPPTLAILEDLAAAPDLDGVSGLAQRDAPAIMPVITQDDAGQMVLALPGDPLHPTTAPAFPHRTRIILDEQGKFASARVENPG
jgi:8-oxo-dGTP pyrophosphatase MutT (NUDIX family)